MSAGRPLVVWAVSDGRAGIEAQVLGLAEAIARRRPAETLVKRVAWKGRAGRRPWWLVPWPMRALDPSSAIAPPWPDIWLAAGRATLPLSLRVRRWSRGRTFVVQTQDPRTPLQPYDLVIPPMHDRLSGENVLPIVGAPNRLTPERLRADLVRFEAMIAPLPHPRAAVLIGGKSKAFDLSPERAAAMARQIEDAVRDAGGSILLTFSRRTPDAARAILAARLRDLPGVIWDGEGENPYFAFLAAADCILATEDSTNLATDAAATGKPVFILKMDGRSEKFRLFHQELERLGVSRPFEGALHGWTYAPLAETDRAAAEILRRYDLKAGGCVPARDAA
ncbi:MAG: mitochondrial fission ELM1 family protein [Phenylobacterium sp.]|uniref:mitochondrial fission ELM1 family protein n=1 Tax=Phenylobacterium sp. TaxID=1871053 RepID=UPI00391B97C5